MRTITVEEANDYLGSVGMHVGGWNQIGDTADGQGGKPYLNYRPPRDNLLNFSYYAANWLPKGKWKILQIDNSSGWIDPVQASLLCGLLFGPDTAHNINQDRTFSFEFGKNEKANRNTELLIANLIYVFLQFELHCYLASSGSRMGELLGIQDGYAYFLTRAKDTSDASNLIRDFERNPLGPPTWIKEIIAASQEEELVAK